MIVSFFCTIWPMYFGNYVCQNCFVSVASRNKKGKSKGIWNRKKSTKYGLSLEGS